MRADKGAFFVMMVSEECFAAMFTRMIRPEDEIAERGEKVSFFGYALFLPCLFAQRIFQYFTHAVFG
ncbi:hypothetical protein SAMN06265361_101186 [Laceyella tengchongensis]|uniref:Uncharacterized protein n=1 Tax=Laceyella tengchongensis TaxID=574699 RepID=A0AA46ACU2_9BACL|nr:hypothetical protein SAMN06265361_101186 [Laceyella tengchongensis]